MTSYDDTSGMWSDHIKNDNNQNIKDYNSCFTLLNPYIFCEIKVGTLWT